MRVTIALIDFVDSADKVGLSSAIGVRAVAVRRSAIEVQSVIDSHIMLPDILLY